MYVCMCCLKLCIQGFADLSSSKLLAKYARDAHWDTKYENSRALVKSSPLQYSSSGSKLLRPPVVGGGAPDNLFVVDDVKVGVQGVHQADHTALKSKKSEKVTKINIFFIVFQKAWGVLVKKCHNMYTTDLILRGNRATMHSYTHFIVLFLETLEHCAEQGFLFSQWHLL